MQWSTAPFEHTRDLCAPAPSLHPGENAVGINNKVALQVAAPSCVNSISNSLTVPRLRSLVLIPSRRLDCLEFLFLSMSPARLHWLCRCISHCFLPTKFLLWVEKLRQLVLTHSDQSFVSYVLDGIQNGFRVGFNSASVSLKSTTHNMSSASLQPLVIDDYLHTELAKGRVAGPFSSPLLPYLHISRFWVILKKYQPGKWRLILDLSSTDGHTVNDGIRKGPSLFNIW